MPPGLLTIDRASCFRGLGYSPARMVATDPALTRESVLERVRARILAAGLRDLSRADAEDLTQETLVLLTTKYAHVEAPEELVALGITILKKKRSALWRRARRRQVLGHEPLPAREDDDRDPVDNVVGRDPGPEGIALDRQRLRFFIEAAEGLDGRCRDLLRRKLEGESFVEIAASLGRPVNTIYSWDHRCRKRLERLLGPRLGFVTGEEGP